MEEKNDTLTAHDLHAVWGSTNTGSSIGIDPYLGGYFKKAIPTLESMQSQLEFLEGMVINLRKQLNELKEDNKKYPKRKLNKNFDIK